MLLVQLKLLTQLYLWMVAQLTTLGKGLGMANEFSLGASGELDNGFTWATNIDIDGATVQDDGVNGNRYGWNWFSKIQHI